MHFVAFELSLPNPYVFYCNYLDHPSLINTNHLWLKSQYRGEPAFWRTSFDFARLLPRAQPNDACLVANKSPNGYQSALVVVIVVVVMPNDYHMVMPIWLRKNGGRNEHKEDKY